jgi:HlyD family secretion protein
MIDDEQAKGPATATLEKSEGGQIRDGGPAQQTTPPPVRNPGAVRGPKKKKPNKGIRIAIVVGVVVLILAVSLIITLSGGKKETVSNTIETPVTRGNIQKMITGSGTVQPIHQYNVVPTVTGDVTMDYITEGQKINQGDPLYAIDATNADNLIRQNENALERAQLTYQQAVNAVNSLNVRTDISGIITKLYVKEGDQVMANAPVAEVVDTTNLTLTVPFNAVEAVNMAVGEDAMVTLESTGTVLSGTVSRVYSGKQIGPNGSLVSSVDISLVNPGVIKAGDVATAVVGGTYACNASGTLAYASDKIITAKTTGQVTALILRAGDAARAGDAIVTLSNDSTITAEQTAALSVQNAENALQNAKDSLNNYNLTSPISGTVIQKNSKAGDTIATTINPPTMAIVADMTSLVLNINVDELDILNLQTGMTAMLTADALPGQFFQGTVTNVSTVGKATAGASTGFSFGGFAGTGVTNYDVEITITDYGALLPGMNVNATIVTDSANNVLLVPQQAVVYGGYVLRKLDGTETPSPSMPGKPQSSQFGGGFSMKPTAPKGYEYVKVEVGITNTMFAEIKSGLKEGDTVSYTVATMPSFGMFGMGPGGGFGSAGR